MFFEGLSKEWDNTRYKLYDDYEEDILLFQTDDLKEITKKKNEFIEDTSGECSLLLIDTKKKSCKYIY